MNTITLKVDRLTYIAEHDFCREIFDNDVFYQGSIRMLYIIISTPRCGSTWLCSEIYNHTGLVIHEYLQPYQYIPYLASRFQNRCPHLTVMRKSSQINLIGYFQCLTGLRARQGVLGINVHISHISLLMPLIDIYRQIYNCGTVQIDYLYRRDKYLQAASHAIAHQTRCWSKTASQSDLQDKTIAVGALGRLSLALRAAKVYRKNIRSENFLRQTIKTINFKSVYCYEDLQQGLITDAVSSIACQLGIKKTIRAQELKPILASQSSSLNKEISCLLKQWMPLLLAIVYTRDCLQALLNLLKIYSHRPSSKTITIEFP